MVGALIQSELYGTTNVRNSNFRIPFINAAKFMDFHYHHKIRLVIHRKIINDYRFSSLKLIRNRIF